MPRRSSHSWLSSLIHAIRGKEAREEFKRSVEADALEARHGDEAIQQVRTRIVSADRSARRELYRLHDELARRRRDHDDPLEGLPV